MIVRVVSLGSLWQESRRQHVFNSTGLEVDGRIRSRARVFGQIRFHPSDLQQLIAGDRLCGSKWTATPLGEYDGVRSMHLLRVASQRERAEWHVVTVSEELLGTLGPSSWSEDSTRVISVSESGSRQQVMLLTKPFSHLRGASGTAVFHPEHLASPWTVNRW